jgi:hypothetical protein
VCQLQTPASFAQSVQELTIALQRTGDPANLNRLRPHLELLANIDPSPGCSIFTSHHYPFYSIVLALFYCQLSTALFGLIRLSSVRSHQHSHFKNVE